MLRILNSRLWQIQSVHTTILSDATEMKGKQILELTQSLITALAFKTNWPLELKAVCFQHKFEMGRGDATTDSTTRSVQDLTVPALCPLRWANPSDLLHNPTHQRSVALNYIKGVFTEQLLICCFRGKNVKHQIVKDFLKNQSNYLSIASSLLVVCWT